MRVAVYGGSFDPPHVGHVLAAAYLLSVGPFDRVLVVPVRSHPFDKPLSPFEDRVTMCERAFELIPAAVVSRVEEQLPAPNRTLDTLEHLVAQHPDWQLRLVIGADVLEETASWYRFDRIEQLAPPWILGRAGVASNGAPSPVLPDVSSTRVRRLFAEANDDALSELVPRAVLEHAHARGLYR